MVNDIFSELKILLNYSDLEKEQVNFRVYTVELVIGIFLIILPLYSRKMKN
jgi:hypothetical protein